MKNIITQFCFKLKILELYLHIIRYKTNLNYSLDKIFKKAEIYLDIFNAKAQIQKKLEL